MNNIGTLEPDALSELRHDPVQRRWVIVASERGRRPMDFVAEKRGVEREHQCPFCAGLEALTPPAIAVFPEEAKGGEIPWKVRVVPNKFPALRTERELTRAAVGPFDAISGVGAHEVVIDTPHHGLDFMELPVPQIAEVLRAYRERILDLRKDSRLRYILVFKNSGSAAGASLSHSHSQIMATPITPRTVAMELTSAREHYQLKERCIFCDLLNFEYEKGERIVLEDSEFVTHCPYASRFPFEMHLFPRRHAHDFALQDDAMLFKLATHLKSVLRRMDRVLENPSFNFLLHTVPSIHKQPTRSHYWQTVEVDWHWHLEILPRLSKVAGFEWGTGFYINPTPPEEAARYLRDVDLQED
jgi:UDPglucose--hexose-1-phosphate uridylyltransferase